MNEPRDGHIDPFFYLCETIEIKAMKMFVVRMSRFCIAISICDCLPQTRWLWYFLLPGVWSWTLEWILMYLQETQGLLPGRFKILSNGKQNSGQEHSTIVFSLHTCVPFTGKRLRGPAMVTRGGLKSWSTSFGRNIPTRETDLLFEDLLLPKIFTWREPQVLLDH